MIVSVRLGLGLVSRGDSSHGGGGVHEEFVQTSKCKRQSKNIVDNQTVIRLFNKNIFSLLNILTKRNVESIINSWFPGTVLNA